MVQTRRIEANLVVASVRTIFSDVGRRACDPGGASSVPRSSFPFNLSVTLSLHVTLSRARDGLAPLRRSRHAWTEITHRKIRDVLRLRAGGMSKRKIAASLSIGVTAAGECVRRARRAGLIWPLPEDLSDAALELRLYPPPQATAKDRRPRQ